MTRAAEAAHYWVGNRGVATGGNVPVPADARLDAAQIETLRKALDIGSISYDGDGWYAKDAGYDYDDAEATLDAARKIIAALDGAA